jgi:hypothetical protein
MIKIGFIVKMVDSIIISGEGKTYHTLRCPNCEKLISFSSKYCQFCEKRIPKMFEYDSYILTFLGMFLIGGLGVILIMVIYLFLVGLTDFLTKVTG